MTVLFAENFESCVSAGDAVNGTLLALRYPGSRHLQDTSEGIGFRLSSAPGATGAIGGGNQLIAPMKKAPVGDKYEIIFGFNGATSTTTSSSGTGYLNVFGLKFQAPLMPNNTVPILVEGLDVGFRAVLAYNRTNCVFHAVLTRLPNNQWSMVTEIRSTRTGGDTEVITRKNVLGTFELTNVLEFSTGGNTPIVYTLPRALNFVAVLADTEAGKMTDLSFLATPMVSKDAQDWSFSSTSLDADVAKPHLDSLNPHIFADSTDATITYENTDTAYHKILALAGTTLEPQHFIKVASGEDSKLLRYNGQQAASSGAPVLNGDEVVVSVKESNLITWLDYDRFASYEKCPLTPDRVSPNPWDISSGSSRGEIVKQVVAGGPFGSGAISAAAGAQGNVLSLSLPSDFPLKGAVIQFWVNAKAGNQQTVLGLGSSTGSFRLAYRVNLDANDRLVLAAAVNNSTTYTTLLTPSAQPDGWHFVTVRLGVPVGTNVPVETWVNGAKAPTVLQMPTASGLTYRLVYSGAVSAAVAVTTMLGNLYVVSGTELPAPVDKPTVASPWPSL